MSNVHAITIDGKVQKITINGNSQKTEIKSTISSNNLYNEFSNLEVTSTIQRIEVPGNVLETKINSRIIGYNNQGLPGQTAYEIAVRNGFDGTEEDWLLSLKGDQGGKGDKGDKGDIGNTGATPYIQDGFWYINGVSTGVKAEGIDGEGTGDMLASVYDPKNKKIDVYDIDNMTESTTKKIMTSTERTKLSSVETGANKYILPTDVVKDSDYVHTDNNYTTSEKNKLAGIEAGANKTTIADNLTTDDSARVLSAKMGKKLNDEKFDKSGGTITGDVNITGSLQVDGTPIIDTFSSSNGNLIKFADGTMIQTKISNSSSRSVALWGGNIYYVDINMGNWLESFIEIYSVISCVDTSQFWCTQSSYSNTSAGEVRLLRPDSYAQTAKVMITAIGRWK